MVVVPAVNKMVCATVLVLEMVLKVFDPVKVKVDMPVAPPMARLLYVKPPPAKVLAVVVVLENKMVDVLALSVMPVAVAKPQTVPVLVYVQVPDPIVNDLATVPVLVKTVADMF